MAARSNLYRYCNFGEHITRDNAPRTLMERCGEVLTLGWAGFIYNVFVLCLMMLPTVDTPFYGLAFILGLFFIVTGWLFAVDLIFLAIALSTHHVTQTTTCQFWASKGYVREGFPAPKGYDRDELTEISNEEISGR